MDWRIAILPGAANRYIVGLFPASRSLGQMLRDRLEGLPSSRNHHILPRLAYLPPRLDISEAEPELKGLMSTTDAPAPLVFHEGIFVDRNQWANGIGMGHASSMRSWSLATSTESYFNNHDDY